MNLTLAPGSPGGPKSPGNPMGPCEEKKKRVKNNPNWHLKPKWLENKILSLILFTRLPLGPSSPGEPLVPGGPAVPGGPESPFSPTSPLAPWSTSKCK